MSICDVLYSTSHHMITDQHKSIFSIIHLNHKGDFTFACKKLIRSKCFNLGQPAWTCKITWVKAFFADTFNRLVIEKVDDYFLMNDLSIFHRGCMSMSDQTGRSDLDQQVLTLT